MFQLLQMNSILSKDTRYNQQETNNFQITNNTTINLNSDY